MEEERKGIRFSPYRDFPRNMSDPYYLKKKKNDDPDDNSNTIHTRLYFLLFLPRIESSRWPVSLACKGKSCLYTEVASAKYEKSQR